MGYTQAANNYNLGAGAARAGERAGAELHDNTRTRGTRDSERVSRIGGPSNQGYNQALSTFNTNYGVNMNNQNTAFNQNLAIAQLGNNASTNYGNNASNLYTNQGNANAGATIGSANAWNGALNNLGNIASSGAYYYGTQPQANNTGMPGTSLGALQIPQSGGG